MSSMKTQQKSTIVLWFLIVIFIASLPLFSKYTFTSLDATFHTQRIWSIKNALLEGQFPVRIYSEIYNGYGYGSSLFYPEMFLYIPAVLCIIGLPLTLSYNLFLIMVNVATILAAYYSFKVIAKSSTIGAIAAVLYELSTYRLLDMYTRGAMGEYLALIFCPLALCGLTVIKRGEYRKWWILAIAFTGLLQSHVLSFVLMTVVAVVFVLINCKSFLCKRAVWAVGKAVIAVTLLNAWFIIPFLQVSGMPVNALAGTDEIWESDSMILQLFDLLLLDAGGQEVYGKSVKHALPVTPGILLLLGVVCMMFAFLHHREEIGEAKRRIAIYLLAGLVTLLMITNIFPWGLLRKISLVESFVEKLQFIWRFNILTILFFSIVAAYGFYFYFVQGAANQYKEVTKLVLLAGAVALIYLNQFVMYANQVNNEELLHDGTMDMLYVVPGYRYEPEAVPISSSDLIEIGEVTRDTLEIALDYTNTKQVSDGYIDIPFTYYPGYQAYINDQKVTAECSDTGTVRVYLPTEVTEGHLQVIYKDEGWTAVGNYVSLIVWVVVIIAGGYQSRKLLVPFFSKMRGYYGFYKK